MAALVFALTLNDGTQSLHTIVPTDVDGNPASVDAAGFVKETIEPDGSDVVIDPRDRNGNLNIIVKPGVAVGSTTQVSGYIDADTGEGLKRIDITFAITLIPKEAVGATLANRGVEPVGAEL